MKESTWPAAFSGTRVQRKEDPKFLTTGGMYVDDLTDELLDGALHVVVRPLGRRPRHDPVDRHRRREDMPGVVGVFTAESLGLEPVPSAFNPIVARTLLASDKVRYVGEPVVAVVAETSRRPTDAAEMVFVDIDFLPTLVDIEAAAASETLIYEAAGSNVVFDTTALGMPENTPTDEFFADCEVVVTGRFLNQRVAPCPLEVRGSAATWVDGRLYQWLSTQHAQGVKAGIAAANGVDGDQVRVITPDVGGGFGAKIGTYAEELLLGALSKALGRPVRWRETRSESMMAPRSRASPAAVRHHRRQPRRQGHALPAAPVPGLGWLRRHRRRPRLRHDPAHGVRRVRHPQHRGPRDHRWSPTPRRRCRIAAPGAPRRPPRPSGRWTCSPPRSAWTRPRCAA